MSPDKGIRYSWNDIEEALEVYDWGWGRSNLATIRSDVYEYHQKALDEAERTALIRAYMPFAAVVIKAVANGSWEGWPEEAEESLLENCAGKLDEDELVKKTLALAWLYSNTQRRQLTRV